MCVEAAVYKRRRGAAAALGSLACTLARWLAGARYCPQRPVTAVCYFICLFYFCTASPGALLNGRDQASALGCNPVSLKLDIFKNLFLLFPVELFGNSWRDQQARMHPAASADRAVWRSCHVALRALEKRCHRIWVAINTASRCSVSGVQNFRRAPHCYLESSYY